MANSQGNILSYFRSRWQAHGSQISQPSPSMADPYGHTIEPLNNTWEVMARMHADDTAAALELLRRLWGLQVDPNSGFYTGTFWEFVMSNGLPDRGFDSLAHAWGAGPTQVLTESVLGANAVNPGYSTWQVKPHQANLAWAQGQVPTASGSLIVRWAQDTAGQGALRALAGYSPLPFSPACRGGRMREGGLVLARDSLVCEGIGLGPAGMTLAEPANRGQPAAAGGRGDPAAQR